LPPFFAVVFFAFLVVFFFAAGIVWTSSGFSALRAMCASESESECKIQRRIGSVKEVDDEKRV